MNQTNILLCVDSADAQQAFPGITPFRTDAPGLYYVTLRADGRYGHGTHLNAIYATSRARFDPRYGLALQCFVPCIRESLPAGVVRVQSPWGEL